MVDHHETEFEEQIAAIYATNLLSEAEINTIVDIDFEDNIAEERKKHLKTIIDKTRVKTVDSISFDLLKYKIADCLTPYDRCVHCRLSKMYCKAFALQNNTRALKRYTNYFNQLLAKICNFSTTTNTFQKQNDGYPFGSVNDKKYIDWETDRPFELNLGRFDALLKQRVEKNTDRNIIMDDDGEEKHEYIVNVQNIDKYNRVEMTCDYFNILFFLIHYPRLNNLFNGSNDAMTHYGVGFYNDNLFDDIIAAHDDDDDDYGDNDTNIEIVKLIPQFLNLNGLIFNKNENIGGKLVSHFVKNLIVYSYHRYKSVAHCWRFIDLSDCNINDDDLFIFLKSIETHCKKLFERNNDEINSYFEHWSRVKSWINIEYIDLSNNLKITDKHMKYLFEYMIPNYLVNLKKIKLSNCGLTCQTLKHISNFLDYIATTLYTLNNKNTKFKSIKTDVAHDDDDDGSTYVDVIPGPMTAKEKRLTELKLSRIILNLSSIDVSKNKEIVLSFSRERRQLKANIKNGKLNIHAMDKSGQFGERLIIETGSGMERDKRSTNRATYNETVYAKYREELRNLGMINGNDKCADCGEINPTWASTNLGVFLCSRCAGAHRLVGAHVTFVKLNLCNLC